MTNTTDVLLILTKDGQDHQLTFTSLLTATDYAKKVGKFGFKAKTYVVRSTKEVMG